MENIHLVCAIVIFILIVALFFMDSPVVVVQDVEEERKPMDLNEIDDHPTARGEFIPPDQINHVKNLWKSEKSDSEFDEIGRTTSDFSSDLEMNPMGGHKLLCRSYGPNIYLPNMWNTSRSDK